MAKPLVIVESPAKARTLSRFLGPSYEVRPSFGHVRDLPESAREVPPEIKDKPWGRLAVDVEGDFTPYYVVPHDKKKHVQSLRAALKGASELILATDPDREGEAISAHLREVLRPRVPTRRIVFHEITEDAVREALANAHDVDDHLVKAQEGRRILDRLFGYTLSPVLWKKVQTGLSAGRVQSIAVRLIVEREEERIRFRVSRYWDVEARLAGEQGEFAASLVRIGDDRIATGKDFDPATGQLASRGVRQLGEVDAEALARALPGTLPWRVTKVEERPIAQRPAPPFTTSTLQQEANRKLGFSADRTMQAAQSLHDEGLISYHRTDSTTLSEKALADAARVIRDMYGDEYHSGPRRYQTRVRNAQEAHEGIRPTDFRRTPQQLAGLNDSDALRVYELIWKRAVASQMADARLLRTTLEITATAPDGAACVFTAAGKAIQFAGYLRAYVEGSDDPAAELGDQETILPKCNEGDPVVHEGGPAEGRLFLKRDGVVSRPHETTPPARYNDATLVRRLEEEGIGRPSTYAPTIETIQRRGYVFRQGKALVPSFTAFAVTKLLREHFTDYVDFGFTAEMEEDLDQVANGERTSRDFIREFYRGAHGRPGLEQRVQSDESIAYPVVDLGLDPETGEPVRVRIGRYGPFVQRSDGGPGNTASLPDNIAPADFTIEQALDLLRQRAEGPRSLGADPQSGEQVFVMNGRYGPYVQLGETPEKAKKSSKPPRASLPRGIPESEVTLETALRLLSLPREVGLHPDDQQAVVANIGRFGPYVKHGDEFRSLDSEEEVFTVTLDRAVELLRQPKRSRRRQAAKGTVLREFGEHPETGAAIRVLDGRYGPYVTDGKTNASLPKGTSPESLTAESALDLLRARAAAGPAKRRPSRHGGSKRLVPA